MGPSEGVGAGERYDALVTEAHAVEHVSEVGLSTKQKKQVKLRWATEVTKLTHSMNPIFFFEEQYEQQALTEQRQGSGEEEKQVTSTVTGAFQY